MILKTVLIRFYKSFNFDYLRKYSRDAIPRPWEKEGDLWFPYVRIPIDRDVTTVVGANESGKSHMLSAISKGISGVGIQREDFCRYSQFFSVERGKMRWPDFGFEWAELTSDEQRTVRTCASLRDSTRLDGFMLFRTGKDRLTVYVHAEDDYTSHDVKGEHATTLLKSLPRVFDIDAHVALPESVPIPWLINQSATRFDRKNRSLLQQIFETNSAWFSSQQTIASAAAEMFKALSPILSPAALSPSREAEFKLAHDLMFKVAKIDSEALSELYKAIRDGKDGHANGITQKLNDSLAKCLNFPRWWVQDRDFQLIVSPRESDLVFTIRDRTETDYSFGERSSGLRHFLSYYIQYLAHETAAGQPEILLMDEPDAYLSSQGQQDLLKIFEAFAHPEDDRARVQVVYVTHSPFLINKNHGERIRVLEKGVGDEGTRVVRDASKNHYEPLRSAFGSFVAETTFIGHCNLIVEGISDQVLLAGGTAYARSAGASDLETLDLNRITIVPAGSASHVPYLVYLARGRDIERPALIVLLDSDEQGNLAKADLLRGGPRRKRLLHEDLILQIGDFSAAATGDAPPGKNGGKTIEDLIPSRVAELAIKRYLREMCGTTDQQLSALTADGLDQARSNGQPLSDAIDAVLATLGNGQWHVDKLGFARSVIDIVSQNQCDQASLDAWQRNMRGLFQRLRQMQRKAERELTTERVTQRVDRAKNAFLRDHPTTAKREQAVVLLEEIDAALDDTPEADEVRRGLQGLRRQFKLADDVTEPIEDYAQFKDGLECVKYAARIESQEPESSDAPMQPLVQPTESPPTAAKGKQAKS